MKDIEHLIKIIQQGRLVNQHKLEQLDIQSDEHKELMNQLGYLRRERGQCKENIIKHLNTISAHKHFIRKIIHSSKDISGLPISQDYAQDMKTIFTDVINFLNNIGNTYKSLNNIEENNIDPLKLIKAVTTCTETVRNELYQTKCCMEQLETLKEDITLLQQYNLNNSIDISSNK